MGLTLRKVLLLGAFEVQGDDEGSSRDGLILGSPRQAMGFVLETSREHMEHIVALAKPRGPRWPLRATMGLGPGLLHMGAELVRVELRALPGQDRVPMQEGRFIQGFLVARHGARKLVRFPMTAAEAIQVAMANGLSIMASPELLQLQVGSFLAQAEEALSQRQVEEKAFADFVKKVTPADFRKRFEAMGGSLTPPDEEEPRD